MQPFAPQPIGLLAAAVRRTIQAAVLSRSGPLGLSSIQFWTLVGVAETPGCSQAELAARLRMDEPALSRALRGLVERGWVRTERDTPDRRRVRLGLTQSGRAMARRVVPLAAEIRAAVEAPLAPEEREVTRAALARIVSHLEGLAAAPAATPSPRPPRHVRSR